MIGSLIRLDLKSITKILENIISWELIFEDSIFGRPFQSVPWRLLLQHFGVATNDTKKVFVQRWRKKLEKLLMKQYILCSSYLILFITTHNNKLVKKRS
jgi:hypothetical protein